MVCAIACVKRDTRIIVVVMVSNLFMVKVFLIKIGTRINPGGIKCG